MKKILMPPALISLVHHIKLNESGWWNKALKRLIFAVVWLSPSKELTREEIKEELFKNFGIEISLMRLKKQIQQLLEDDILVTFNSKEFKITETALKNFETELKENEDLENYARNKFSELLKTYCPELPLDKVWPSFCKELLSPLIREMGAKTYELISGKGKDLDSVINIDLFLGKYSLELRGKLQRVISAFIEPNDSNIRLFILHQLNAYFFLEAGSLSDETLQTLSNISNEPSTFNIFIDTNFLFSILGIVENLYNDAAKSLLTVINRIKGKVNVKLYVSSLTIREAKGVLVFQKKKLEELDLPPFLAEVISEREELSSFAKKFLIESKKSKYSISVDDYFNPFINNLTLAIESKGVIVYEKDIADYKTRPLVLNDIIDQREFEKRRYGDRAKKHEQLMHDIALWHFVKELRPDSFEFPKEASFWIVTVDNRFLGFDSFKKGDTDRIPLCIHPTTLIQMLQFWVPRTSEIEEAILHNLRLPFLFWQPFDAEAERVTLSILKALSRYENINEIDKSTLASILVNEVLRQKIQEEKEEDKHHKLIREAVIVENERIKNKLKEEEEKLTHLEKIISAKDREFNEMLFKKNQEILRLKEKIEKQLSKISRKKKKKSEKEIKLLEEKDSLEKRIETLEKSLAVSEKDKKSEKEKNLFIIKNLFIPFALIILLECGVYLLSEKMSQANSVLVTISIGFFLILAWIYRVDKEAGKNSEIRNLVFFRKFNRIKKRIFITLSSITISFIVWGLIEVIRSLL